VELKPHQKQFEQSHWKTHWAPNMAGKAKAPDVIQFSMKTPPEPWGNIDVIVIRGNLRYRAKVIGVSRGDSRSRPDGLPLFPSGVCITVSYDQVSIGVQGFGMQKTWDYTWIRDTK
jgi:hypothetical protein